MRRVLNLWVRRSKSSTCALSTGQATCNFFLVIILVMCNYSTATREYKPIFRRTTTQATKTRRRNWNLMDKENEGKNRHSNINDLEVLGASQKALNAAVGPPFKLYKRRWFGIFLILLLNISSQINWLTFGPVAPLAVEYYNIDYNALNWLSNM